MSLLINRRRVVGVYGSGPILGKIVDRRGPRMYGHIEDASLFRVLTYMPDCSHVPLSSSSSDTQVYDTFTTTLIRAQNRKQGANVSLMLRSPSLLRAHFLQVLVGMEDSQAR